MFCQSNTVYILLHAIVISGLNIRLSSTEHYIGSTIHTLHDRQNTRQRKLRQLKQAQPVSCELALHWFCSQNNYYQFVALPLLHTNTTLQTRTLESYIIQKWRPPLNYPFILQRQVTKQHSTPHLRQALRTTYLGIGNRLYAQLRRRLMYQQVFQFYDHNLSKHTTAWVQLHILAEQSQRSFDMQRHIRSSSTHSNHLFALYKLANQMDDPPRTRVRSLIKSAIQFRQLPLPPTPRPLILPLLCHTTFATQTRIWLRQLARQQKPWLPPFHVPKCNITAGKHTTLKQALFSHFSWMRQFQWHIPPACLCHQITTQHPQLLTTTLDNSPHIASPAGHLTIPFRLQQFLSTHAGTQVYPTRQHYIQCTWPTLQRWLQHHNLFNITYEHWHQHVHEQWTQHLTHAQESVTHRDIKYLKSITKSLVVHVGTMHHQPFLFSVHTSTGPFFAGLLETLQFTHRPLSHQHKQHSFSNNLPTNLGCANTSGVAAAPTNAPRPMFF